MRCSPTLLALTLGLAPVALHAAAADVERDEHARAIKALIDHGAKLAVERQMKEFSAAGYNDGGIGAALQYNVKLAFQNGKEEPPPAGASAIVRELYDGGSGIDALVKALNDARRIMDTDGPKPKVKPADEKITAFKRTVQRLVDRFPKAFADGLAAVKANKDNEEKAWEEQNDKKLAQINQQAVMLRLDALRPFFLAHLVLREVSTRGADFGVDPAPINTALAAFCKEHRELISEWDFQFAEMHPQLQMYCAVFAQEAVRQKVNGADRGEAESSMMRLIDLDLDAVPKGAQDDVRTLKAKAWGSLLRWYLELGDAKALERGASLFGDFKNRQKESPKDFPLNHPDPERAAAVAAIYVVAGRLLAARNDSSGAQALWAEVSSQNKTPLATLAKKWMTGGGGDMAPGSSPWAKVPVPSDPSSAVALGRSLISEAWSASPKEQRQYYMSAAVGLRDGVLGLNTRTYADQFVAQGPAVYRLYATALVRLGMMHHAVAAAHEGLRLAGAEIARRKSNPWKDAKEQKTWTQDAGKQLEALCTNALSYAANLNARSRTPATKKLFDEVIEAVKVIDAEMVGEGLEWQLIVGMLNEGNFPEAIDALKAYAKKYPHHFLKCANRIISARQGWIDKLEGENSAAAKQKAEDVNKELVEGVEKLDAYVKAEQAKVAKEKAEEKGKKDPAKEVLAKLEAREKELRNTAVSVGSTRVRGKLRSRLFTEIITTDLGTAFWKRPPTDQDLAAALLGYLARAVNEYHLELSGIKDPRADKPKPVEADKLVAAWKLYAPAMADFSKMMKHYGAEFATQSSMTSASLRLAQVAQYVTAQGEMNIRQKAGGEEMAAIVESAKRAFADFIEPTIGPRSKAGLILAVGQTLWELDEHPRAARLFELYKATLAEDELVKSYNADPKATVEQFAAILAVRQEFKNAWAEVVDLLTDPEGYITDLLRNGSAGVAGRGQKRDYALALVKIDALRALINGAGFLEADVKKKALESCDRLRGMASGLALQISIDEKLAQHYREVGDAAKAVEIYKRLYSEYDPQNPKYAMGYVEGVLQALKVGQQVADDALKGARVVAAENRDKFQGQPLERDSYWTSWLQVLELTKHMEETERKLIKPQLAFTINNKTSPRDDLHLPVRKGDDPRVRRARDKSAVDIAGRYLALFEGTDLTPPFRVETVEGGGRSYDLFIDAGAPAMQVVAEEIDGEDVTVIKAVDAPAAPAPAPAPAAPTPAPAETK